MNRFWSKVDKSGDCWEWLGAKTPNGYGTFRSPAGKMIGSHRMAYILEHGGVPDGLLVCHKCDNRSCVNPQHLFVGTHKDNYWDSRNKRRAALGANLNHPEQVGEKNHNSKLTRDVVVKIRKLYASGMSQAAIARKLGVSRLNIWNIVHYKSWTHV